MPRKKVHGNATKSPGAALQTALEAAKVLANETPRPSPLAAFVSDPHVGLHARYGGPTVDGLNRRARETIDVLRRAVAAAVDRGAGSFVVCGDLFQTARPEPAVIRAVQDIFAAARDHLRVIAIPGNHDMPDATCEAGNTAMAPLFEVATIVTSPEVVRIPAAGGTATTASGVTHTPILCVPFDGRRPMAEHLAGVLSTVRSDVRILATHVGVWDAKSAAPWMKKARDGIDAETLFALMEKAGIDTAFVGNYHEHRTWNDTAGAPGGQLGRRNIVQVGTLCPASHGDGGLVDRGLVAFLEEDGSWSKQEIPGPRFVTIDSDQGEDLGPAPPGGSYYVRDRGSFLKVAEPAKVGWAAFEPGEVKAEEGDPEPVFVEETDEEAIAAAVAEMEVPALASRDAVRELALACWKKAS